MDKFTHVRFEPSGFTGNPQIPIAKSIVDYVFRWMALQFLPKEEQPSMSARRQRPRPRDLRGDRRRVDAQARAAAQARERDVYVRQADAPPCHECGSIMIRNGACYACVNCGSTSGCS